VLAVARPDAVGPISRCGYGRIDVRTFLGLYHATSDLITSADDAAMVEAYVVGMIMPEELKEEGSENDNIEVLLSSDDDADVRRRLTNRRQSGRLG
jgi:hypothetical protein